MREHLFSSILAKEYVEINKYHSAELINRLTNDIGIISTNIIDVVPQMATLISSVIFSFIAMFRIDSILSFVCILLGPLVMVSSFLYGKKIKPLHKKCRQSEGTINSFMQECIHNLIAVKSFCGESQSCEHIKKLHDDSFKINMKRGRLRIIINILYYFSATAAFYFSIAWCAYKMKYGFMPVGSFAAIIQFVTYIQSPFKNIAGIIPQIYATIASAERILEIEGLSSDEICQDSGSKLKLYEFESLEAKNISFSYNNECIFKDAFFLYEKEKLLLYKVYRELEKVLSLNCYSVS